MSVAPAVFGNFTIDDLVFADGTTRWAVPGGTAAYAALGAALWTGSATAVAPLGADYPRALLRGVDCSRCPITPHTLRNWGLYEEDGTRHFISRGQDRDWLSFCPTPEDVSTGTQTAAHLAAMPLERVQLLIQQLRRCHATILSLDADNHDLHHNPSSTQAHLDLVQQVDLYMPSQQDIARLLPGMPLRTALHALRDHAPNTALIALKLGEAGVLAHIAGSAHCIHLPSAVRSVIDTTGAGDAFCGGALAALSMGLDPVDAILQGSVSAAFCVEAFGWAGLLECTDRDKSHRLSTLRNQLSVTLF